MLRKLFVSAALLAAAALPAQPRVTGSLDLGASAVQYADSLNLSSATLAPSLQVAGDLSSIALSGTFSQSSGGWSFQGGSGVSAFTPGAGPLRGEVAGNVGGSAHRDGNRTIQLSGLGRAHLMYASSGVWLGAGAGRNYDGLAWRPLLLGEAGGWVRPSSATTLLATVVPQSVSGTGGDVRFTDAAVAGRMVASALELQASAGTRIGGGLEAVGGREGTWGSLGATVWIARNLALTGSAGTYPIDIAQGYPGGRFASVALRIARRPAIAASNPPAGETGPAIGSDRSAPQLVLTGADGGTRGIRIVAEGASSVAIAGAFSNWQPIALTRTERGVWTSTILLNPGSHEIAVRVDDGRWRAPAGTTPFKDEFGGESGLLVLP